MKEYISRYQTSNIISRLSNNPAVVLLGPRQCGKSTLGKSILEKQENAVYIDCENPSDLNKLNDPPSFFNFTGDRLVCLDEIQRVPGIFPFLRSWLDEKGANGRLILLGSASPVLLKQSSETLAGRAAFIELTPFHVMELKDRPGFQLRDLLVRGGYPRSFLNPDNEESFAWRTDFIRTYLERDVPGLGIKIPARSIERLWTMCAHLHGQVLNLSKLGGSLGINYHTVRSHLEILEYTYNIRVLQPYFNNMKKRTVKAPKIYLRDSGILLALLGIKSYDSLLSHPSYGASWEGFVIENILNALDGWKAYYYRSHAGAEIDLVLEKGARLAAVECKTSSDPKPGRGFHTAMEDLGIQEGYVAAPVESEYPISKNVMVSPLAEIISKLS